MHVKMFWLEKAQGFVRVEQSDGITPLIYHIDSPIAKRYSGLGLILKDLRNTLEVIKHLLGFRNGNSPQMIKQSASFYAVITYAKCFAEAEGRGTQLQAKDALKYADGDSRSEHERIIHQRNKYVAHAGLEGYEHNPIVATLNRDTGKKEVLKIYDNVMGLSDIDSQLDNFYKLVHSVIKYVEEVKKTTFDRLQKDLSEMDIETLYKESIDPEKFDLVDVEVH